MNEYFKNLDNSLFDKYNVNIYRNNYDINDFIINNDSDEPFYLIDLGDIFKLFNNWINLMPNIKPFYAVKCNPNLAIIETLSFLGVSFDCASEKEINTVLEITKDPSRIIFANPCKMISHLKYAKEKNVDLMTFDNEEELYKIKMYYPDAKIVLRLAVDESSSICKFNKKFGCYIGQVEEILKIVSILGLNLIGLSFHVGSGCSSGDSFYSAIETCKQAKDIAKKLNFNISLIDIGGGFPGNNQEKFNEIAQKIDLAINTFFYEEIQSKSIKFIAEPGRYFSEKSHTLILKVIGKKKNIDLSNNIIMIYYLNDGIYNSFNCIYFDHQNPTIIPFTINNNCMYPSILFGPTCDSLDLIKENIILPELVIGDWLYVENFGAYTISASSEFNGIKKPLNKYIFTN
jgi:ornithine decarboxylase